MASNEPTPNELKKKQAKWKLPPGVVDVTSKQSGKTFAIIGVPPSLKDAKPKEADLTGNGNRPKKVAQLLTFRVTPPDGTPFFASVVKTDDGPIAVMTTRTGAWKKDAALKASDLMFPEQHLNEWEVDHVEPEDAPQLEQGRARAGLQPVS